MLKYIFSAALFAAAGAVNAAPVTFVGDVTPNTIFGSGNGNGGFTVTQDNGVEIGIRGKLRYDINGSAQDIFNYDAALQRYVFSPAASDVPPDRSAFNFDWSINSSFEDGTRSVGELFYTMTIDFDPTENISGLVFDPINVACADHAFGTNGTANDGGSVADCADYEDAKNSNNVAQNSWNLGFFNPAGFDPETEGLYTISLMAFGDSEKTSLLASTSIDIQYGDVPPVPLPATLPLMLAALGIGGFAARRRKA